MHEKGESQMKLKIGFSAGQFGEERAPAALPEQPAPVRQSLVQVHFPARNLTLSYYNDSFPLKVGDLVYVDGKLEGLRGRVTGITYHFKIRLSDYKRVIAVADTQVRGRFYFAGSHFVTFDPASLPYSKAVTWFKAPEREDEVYACGSDDTGFLLDDLSTMDIRAEIAERGHAYYAESRVRYLCLDGTEGHAIVEGTQPYELEFAYRDGEILNLTCGCFCSYPCKHAFAAMLQLRETLAYITKHYASHYEASGCFAAVSKDTLLRAAIDGKEGGSILLE